jgi:hypothetical protein
MQTTVRGYSHAADYANIGRFLVRTYGTMGGHINWLSPRWEYMHYHPLVRGVDLNSIGIWEVGGEIVGVVHPEHFIMMPELSLADLEWLVADEPSLQAILLFAVFGGRGIIVALMRITQSAIRNLQSTIRN